MLIRRLYEEGSQRFQLFLVGTFNRPRKGLGVIKIFADTLGVVHVTPTNFISKF